MSTNPEPHTWFRAEYYSRAPEEVRVIRFTDASVWLEYGGRRPRHNYFPTLREAVAHLRDKAQERIADLDRNLKSLQESRAAAVRALDRLNAELESGKGTYVPRLEPSNATPIV